MRDPNQPALPMCPGCGCACGIAFDSEGRPTCLACRTQLSPAVLSEGPRMRALVAAAFGPSHGGTPR